MQRDQFLLDIHHELIVDNFAGGGGASTGIEMALGRHVDIAINHDPEAVAMHGANHPQAAHYCESVWDVNPRELTQGRPIGLAWFSPACTHFSKAKGGKPLDKKIRGLAWVVLKWASLPNKPRVIILENVEEFRAWGPLLANGFPCPKNKGRTFNSFINALKKQGYSQIEFKELVACDYGAPTRRKRLFLIARCDGQPIVWPKPTHGAPSSPEVLSGQLLPYLTAGDHCIDWSIPCKSIFERKTPLAENTLRRIYRGMDRYVINAETPYLVPNTGTPAQLASVIKHYGGNYTGAGLGCDEPMHTTTTVDHHALVVAHITKFRTGSTGSDCNNPMPTVTAGAAVNPAGNSHAMGIVAAHLVRQFGNSDAAACQAPVGVITAGGGGKTQVATYLLKLYGTCQDGQAANVPLPTVTAGGNHIAEVRALLAEYAADGTPVDDQLGLVEINGQLYQIVDIGMRMLEPHELYAAQGFPRHYIKAPTVRGKPLPKHAQVRMAGNSVCPPMAAALVKANVPEMAVGYQPLKKQKAAA